ncbi:ATP-binding cassette domain-containing protein [Streptomyces sp. So13.3]|uniref:ATP-binding cassette domain-containing protein n=1 Tax=Streptomyces sp. So13.3 TaxID=2136173 RepID=UPI001105B16A|nr:ATP-binding cassette domain-containing protein [Streptomyces sp. So13.3]QNA72664.1 ATP-binding cassette domain-containing protein [Streptomyces sp. So13.3]
MSVEIALYGARVRYGPLEALHGVDLVVPRGSVTVLLGRNGAGRTTALHALAGSVPLSAGRVLWRGADVTRLPAHRRARLGLAFVPDRRPVFGSLTVAENLALFTDQGQDHGQEPALDALEALATSEVFAVFPALRPLLGRRAGTLSGGEQRMLAVSRALLTRARLVLLDEPGLGLSPRAAAHAYGALAGLTAGGGRTVVVAEQRLPAALRPATTVVHELRRGEVVFTGEPAERPE